MLVPPPPQPSAMGVATSSSSPQRLDPLATDYGNIDDLCDLCIGYGAMNVLEEVISTRIASAKQQDVNQHTAAVLARICTYCETHRHFNYLYQFQVNGTPFSLFTSFSFYLEGMIFYHSYLSSGSSVVHLNSLIGSGNQERSCCCWTMLYSVIYEFFFTRGSCQTLGECKGNYLIFLSSQPLCYIAE
ncbi:hypothetical protein POTOM_060459 [Populus tomentosa]|uniref:Uncharacterized protein n=1 Tax=Populus tomentosa TaxID=118781 RepID=A0A8X7XRY5_POPTO|nr:hypothetical protein POTOM_060459 [Populus tomentosa]